MSELRKVLKEEARKVIIDHDAYQAEIFDGFDGRYFRMPLTDSEAIGKLIASYFKWETRFICECFHMALKESSAHDKAMIVNTWI